MDKFVIRGAKPLSGSISVGGSKNAALPLIFASLIVKGKTTLKNIPDISDVSVALDIISRFGAKITRCGDMLEIDSSSLSYVEVSEDLTSRLRASSYLIGATLARFGRAEISRYGGCNFDNRPIDMHIYAAECLGAKVSGSLISAKKLVGGEIRFQKISVGATVNAIFIAACAIGESRIYSYAKEPHVIALIDFLRSAGASIELTPEYISIIGAELTFADAEVIPDMIEAGTYLSLSVMTDSKLNIIGADPAHLCSFLQPLVYSGIVLETSDGGISLSGAPLEPIDVITAPYPAFPTDLQPTIAPLLAAFCGGRICEGVWHKRFGYLSELEKFGVKYRLFDGYAEILPSKITHTTATAPDLRGGAALLMCALFAKGESILLKKDLIQRGYGDIIKKLKGVGADISEL